MINLCFGIPSVISTVGKSVSVLVANILLPVAGVFIEINEKRNLKYLFYIHTNDDLEITKSQKGLGNLNKDIDEMLLLPVHRYEGI